jgi:phosphatidate cytidylyltransferase
LNKLLSRSITGIIFVIISIAAIILSEYLLMIFILFICISALYEYYKLISKAGRSNDIPGGILSTCVIVAASYFSIKTGNIHWLILILSPLIILPLSSLIAAKNINLKNIFHSISGIIYLGIPSALALAIAIPQGVFKGEHLLEILILIWIFDTMAYVSGSLIGKTKMAPKLSPQKTWEGFAGGAIFTLAVSYPISFLFKGWQLETHIILAVIVVLFATPGDLLASHFKRLAQVKDTGTLLPGHGGVLDRFDSFLLVVPVAWIYLLFIN